MNGLQTALRQRIPQARLQRHLIGNVYLDLLQDDFPHTPLAPEVASAVWDAPPYWAFAWPGGIYLSEWLPERRPAGKIVDLGCGSGILSIALTKAGCEVWAVDSDPEARLASAHNASLNGVDFPILSSLEEVGSCDLLVLADFLYDPSNLKGIEGLCQLSQQVLLADCRLKKAPPYFEVLGSARRRIVPDLDWGNEFDQVFLAQWKR